MPIGREQIVWVTQLKVQTQNHHNKNSTSMIPHPTFLAARGHQARPSQEHGYMKICVKPGLLPDFSRGCISEAWSDRRDRGPRARHGLCKGAAFRQTRMRTWPGHLWTAFITRRYLWWRNAVIDRSNLVTSRPGSAMRRWRCLWTGFGRPDRSLRRHGTEGKPQTVPRPPPSWNAAAAHNRIRSRNRANIAGLGLDVQSGNNNTMHVIMVEQSPFRPGARRERSLRRGSFLSAEDWARSKAGMHVFRLRRLDPKLPYFEL